MDRKKRFAIATALLSAVFVSALFLVRPLPIVVVFSVVSFGVTAAALENIFFQHDLIRDRYTFPGVALGIFASACIPSLQNDTRWWRAGIGAAFLAFGTLGLLVIIADILKRLSGPRVVRFDEPTPFTWHRFNNTASLEVGGELFSWSGFFHREADELRIECEAVSVDSKACGAVEIVFRFDRLFIGGRRQSLIDISEIHGFATHLAIPREAFGFGVAKALGAFMALFGWRGALFTLAASSMLATGATPFIRRSRTTDKLPFMPFLSAAALLWMLCGPELLAWYLAFAHREK